jgi:hypothetical protein
VQQQGRDHHGWVCYVLELRLFEVRVMSTADYSELPVIELVLRAHQENYSDIILRWQQVESKINSYIVTLGIVIAALAVLLQVTTIPKFAVVMAAIALFLAALSMVLCLMGLRVQDVLAPPNSEATLRMTKEYFRLVSRAERFENHLQDISTDWIKVITEGQMHLKSKAEKAVWALYSLVATSLFAIGSLFVVFACRSS